MIRIGQRVKIKKPDPNDDPHQIWDAEMEASIGRIGVIIEGYWNSDLITLICLDPKRRGFPDFHTLYFLNISLERVEGDN